MTYQTNREIPALFNIVRRKHDIVAQVCNSSHLNISFRRNLTRNNLRDWNKIVACLLEFNLQDGRDQLIWSLHSFGQYSVRLLQAVLVNNGVQVSQKIWKSKLPATIKVLLWYLKRGVVLTNGNLGKPNWYGDKNCCFCHLPETIHHLFFQCSYAGFLWQAVQVSFGININSC